MDTYKYDTQSHMQDEFQPAAEAPAFVSANSVPLLSNHNTTDSERRNTEHMPEYPADNNMQMQILSASDHVCPFLKNNIGRWARIDFLIGSGMEQRIGQIMEVGRDYLVLRAMEPETVVMCDLFAIKFVTIIMDDDVSRLFFS